MQRYRITFLTGLAVGFVLGARAGRERYEQIKRATRRVTDSPAKITIAAAAFAVMAAGLTALTGTAPKDVTPATPASS